MGLATVWINSAERTHSCAPERRGRLLHDAPVAGEYMEHGMAGDRSRSLRTYLRGRKAQIRRESSNPEPAIDALMRQFPRPARAAGDVITPGLPRTSRP